MAQQKNSTLRSDIKVGGRYLLIILVPFLILAGIVGGVSFWGAWMTAQASMQAATNSQFDVEQSSQQPETYAGTLLLAQDCMAEPDYTRCDNGVRATTVRELWGDVVTINGETHLVDSDDAASAAFQGSPASEVPYAALKHVATSGQSIVYADDQYQVTFTYSIAGGRIRFTSMDIAELSQEAAPTSEPGDGQ